MKEEIKKIVEKHIIKSDELIRSDDIQENINNGYYGQRKYEYIDRDVEKLIKDDIEEFVNDTSQPREYHDRLRDSTQIYVKIRREFGQEVYNNKKWLDDFLTENNIEVDGVLGKAISQLIYEIEPDSYNLVSTAEDIMVVVNASRL